MQAAPLDYLCLEAMPRYIPQASAFLAGSQRQLQSFHPQNSDQPVSCSAFFGIWLLKPQKERADVVVRN